MVSPVGKISGRTGGSTVFDRSVGQLLLPVLSITVRHSLNSNGGKGYKKGLKSKLNHISQSGYSSVIDHSRL